MYRRSDGTTDPLLDANGVLIPKNNPPLYSKSELESYIQNRTKAAITKKNSTLVLDAEIENSIYKNNKGFDYVSFEFAQKNSLSRNFDGLLMPSDIVNIIEASDNSELCASLCKGDREWFDIAWERKQDYLIVYKRPKGIYMADLMSPSGNPSIKTYKKDKLSCENAFSFKIGHLPANVAIKVTMIDPKLHEILFGRKIEDCPLGMVNPFVYLPEHFSFWPVGFKIENENLMMKGADFCTFRGVKKRK